MKWILPIVVLALASCDGDDSTTGTGQAMGVIDRGDGSGAGGLGGGGVSGEAGAAAEGAEGGGEASQGESAEVGEGGEGEGEGEGAGEGEGEGLGGDEGAEGEGGEGASDFQPGEGGGEGAGEGEGEGAGEGGEDGGDEGGGVGDVVVGDCELEAEGQCLTETARAPEEVCERYFADYPARGVAPIWTPGDVQCEPGRLHEDGKGDALRRVNLYRWLAGLDPVDDDPGRTTDVQSCAVMQSTSGVLNHFPGDDAICRTDEGAEEAARSNLSIGQATPAGAVDSQMIDAGASNEQVLGHRRWLLYRPLTEIAVGYAHTGERPATCVHVVPAPFVNNRLEGFEGLVFWPPAGPAPFELVHPPNARNNVPRWSVVAPNVDFSNASARVFIEATPGAPAVDDVEFPSTSGQLADLLEDGLWIQPDVDTPIEPGATYRIEVTGSTLGDFAWRTTFVRCGLVVPEICDPILQDCPLPGTGCYGLDGQACKDTALPRDGEACVFDRQCPRGTTCAQWPEDGNICSAYCSTADDAPEGMDCATVCPQGVFAIDDDRGWAICRPPDA